MLKMFRRKKPWMATPEELDWHNAELHAKLERADRKFEQLREQRGAVGIPPNATPIEKEAEGERN